MLESMHMHMHIRRIYIHVCIHVDTHMSALVSMHRGVDLSSEPNCTSTHVYTRVCTHRSVGPTAPSIHMPMHRGVDTCAG